ncbi:hypothetical protein [Sphingomonas asaccharolytica]|uniref:hypothetical protein n=1 Tax=Sphingomonas asaccharolytica TaxID=40681 RepID=UPI0008370875|nr:hypothetical protein [Sphingomonas asaccharolytica]
MPLDLVVLQISEDDLRSALTAKLTMMGFNVITLRRGQLTGGLSGSTIEQAVLITDDEALAACSPLPGWLQVILLNGSSGDVTERPLRLSGRDATRSVGEVLARWHNSSRLK